MAVKLTYLTLLTSFLSFSTLSGQHNISSGTDTTVNSVDSLWLSDQAFNSALIIPSYEELLKVYFEAVVEVDKHLNFNPYRFQPGNTATVNPFVYKDIILPEGTVPNLEEYEDGFIPKGTFEASANDALWKSRTHIAQSKPELITATWDMLPDAPKTEINVSSIQSVNLDLREIDKRSRNIGRPDRIKKDHYIYAPWKIKIVSMLSANQTAFSNWGKGGLNSFSLSGRVVSDADYMSFDKKTRWDNDLEFRLGYVQQEDEPLVKNLDFFRINTQFARNAVNKWFYAVNAEFTSQFFEGYDLKKGNYEDPISAFMAPAYLKVAMGLDYKYGTRKNKKLFSMQASPLSLKMTYVSDTARINQKKYGVDADKKSRQEIGGSVQFSTDYSYNSKVRARSRLLFFSNYKDKPQNIDVNWNTDVTYNINRIFAVTFSLNMIYDDDVAILLNETEDGIKTYGQRLQVKEYLGFALTYRFM